MSIVLSILLTIASLIALFLIIALFVSKKYTIGREVIINQPKQVVFDYLRYLKNQDHFNKWIQKDPDMKKEFRGTDGKEGFVYAWNGNKDAGEGELELKKITEGERIDQEIRFVRPMPEVALTYFATESLDATQTKVKWVMSSELKYPVNFMNLFLDNLLGKDIAASLDLLKKELEK